MKIFTAIFSILALTQGVAAAPFAAPSDTIVLIFCFRYGAYRIYREQCRYLGIPDAAAEQCVNKRVNECYNGSIPISKLDLPLIWSRHVSLGDFNLIVPNKLER